MALSLEGVQCRPKDAALPWSIDEHDECFIVRVNIDRKRRAARLSTSCPHALARGLPSLENSLCASMGHFWAHLQTNSLMRRDSVLSTSPTIAGMYVTNSGYPAGGYCRPLRASSTDMTLPSGPRNVIFWGHVVSILLIRSRASGFQSDPGFSL
jgi:hypothetical protein